MSKSEKDSSPATVMAELLNVVTPQVERIEEGFKVIRVTLDALADHLRNSDDASAPSPPRDEPTPSTESTSEPVAAAPQATTSPPVAVPVQTPPTPSALEPLPAAPPQSQPDSATIAVTAGDGGNWSQIIFGDHLGTIPGMSAVSGSLLSDVYAGDNDAIGLLGQLLTFRSATAERKPKLLKDIGEAFYLWRPRGEPAMRDALIAWIHALLEESGIANRIEIVQIGDRYDLQRHNSRERGVEVGDVYGWAVLRENGKVYSKASVSAK